MSDSLRPHGLWHGRTPCPSPSPRVYSNSRALSQGCHPAISSSVYLLLLPSIFPSIRVFTNESVLHIRWPKYWSFSFSLNEYSELISLRMNWLDLLAVQGTLKTLLQHNSSNELALRIRWSKYWSFSFSNNLSNEYSELISFRIDWFDVLVVQETLKSRLQHQNLKVSVLWYLAFLMVLLSHHTWLLEKP